MISYVNSELFNMDGVHKQINIAYDGGTITNSQIHFEQFELTESINSEGQLVFGSCEASMLKFRIVNPFNSLMGKELDVSMILNKDEANPFTFGKYYVASDKPSADRKYRDIVAYDRLYEIMNANVSDWYNALFTEEKPEMTLREFRDSFFEYFGIEQEEVALANDAMVVSKTIDGNQITGKIVLNAICEINGCFGRIGRNGKFKYIVLNNQSGNAGRKTLASNEYIGSPTYEDYLVRPMTGLQIRTQENDIGVNIGTEENKYVIQDNFLVYGKGTEELTEIVYNVFNQIYYVTYIPFTTQTLGDPTAEPGDLITINTKTVTLDSYILNRTIKGIQALRDTFSATGNEYYQENTNSVMAEIIKLKGKSNVLERSIEETKSTIEDVEKGLKTEITQTAEGLRIEVAGKYATQEDVASSLENLQQQIDGAIETYTASNIPTLENYPANEWSDEEKETHIGDLYIVNSNGGDYAGFYYRFEKDGDEYYWTLLRDNEITKALQDAEEANKKAQEALNASITGVDVQYALSDSPSVAPTSGWSTTAPEWVDGKYMWQKTVTTYGSGATSESTPTNITGATGKGVSSIVEQYYLSSSNTTQTGGSWSTTSPAWEAGYYIWTRSYITWSDNTTSTTTPVLAGAINSANQNAEDAKKTATSFIQYDSKGIVLGDIEDGILANNVQITTGALNIREGDAVVASFSENLVELGKNSKEAEINLCGGFGKIYVDTAETISYASQMALAIEAPDVIMKSATSDNAHSAKVEVLNGISTTDESYAQIIMQVVDDTAKEATLIVLGKEYVKISSSRMQIDAPISTYGDVTVRDGDVAVTDGDVIADGVSLKSLNTNKSNHLKMSTGDWPDAYKKATSEVWVTLYGTNSEGNYITMTIPIPKSAISSTPRFFLAGYTGGNGSGYGAQVYLSTTHAEYVGLYENGTSIITGGNYWYK